MKTHTVIAILTLSSIATSQLQAEGTTIGIGAGFNDGLTIYLPIKTDRLLIEPSIFLNNGDSDSTDSNSNNENEYSSTEIGTGIYKYTNAIENTFIYYGVKIGYIERERNSIYTTSTFTSSSSSKQDGYFIAPTIGAEHYLAGNFSIGIDISFSYSKTNGNETSVSSSALASTSPTDIKQTSYNTKTEVIVRYHF